MSVVNRVGLNLTNMHLYTTVNHAICIMAGNFD